MPLTSRDILFVLRAQDFATRELQKVARSFGTVGNSIGTMTDQLVAQKAAYRAANAEAAVSVAESQKRLMAQKTSMLAQDRKQAAHNSHMAARARADIANLKLANFDLQSAMSTGSEVAMKDAQEQIMVNRRRMLELDVEAKNAMRHSAQLSSAQRQKLTELETELAMKQALKAQGATYHKQEIAGIEAEIAALKRKSIATAEAAQSNMRKGTAQLAGGIGLGVLGAIGIGAVKGLADATAEYRHQATLTRTQVDKLNVSVADIEDIGTRVASKIGVPLEEIQDGLFDIFSTVDVGAPAAEHMLNQFAKAAVAGQTDIRTASRSAMALMNAYQRPVSEVNKLLDLQFFLVKKGAGTYAEFAKVLGRAAPTAKGFGQEIETLFGMITFLTRAGQNSAESATSAARAIELLYNPKSVDNLRKLGVEATNADGSFRQLDDVLNDLMTKGGFAKLSESDFNERLIQVFGKEGRVAARRFFNLARDGMLDFSKRVEDLSTEAKGAMVEAFNTMADTSVEKMKVVSNVMKAVKISFGDAVEKGLNRFADVLLAISRGLLALDPKIKTVLVGIIGLTSVIAIVSGIMLVGVGSVALMTAALMQLGYSAQAASAKIFMLRQVVLGAFAFGSILIILYQFREELATIFEAAIRKMGEDLAKIPEMFSQVMNSAGESVGNGLRGINEGFGKGLTAVLTTVTNFTMAIYNALKRLNPFQRFSPSLVENVTEGVKVIVQQYARLREVVPSLKTAQNAVTALKDEMADLIAKADASERAELEKYLALAGPGAVAAYDAARGAVGQLKNQLSLINDEYIAQIAILDQLEAAVQSATRAIDAQQAVVDALNDQLKPLNVNLRALNNELRLLRRDLRAAEAAYASLYREGVTPLEDALERLNAELKVEQRELRKLQKELTAATKAHKEAEDAVASINTGIDDARKQMDKFANAVLKGSKRIQDALFGIDQKVAKTRKLMIQFEKLGAPPETLQYFQYQLDQLGLQAEDLQLEDKLELDPLRKKLKDAVDDTKEMTFEEAMEGIENSRKAIEDFEAQLPGAMSTLASTGGVLDEVTGRYNAQKDAVEELQGSVEDMQEQIELAIEKLAPYKAEIDEVKGKIDDLSSVIADAEDEIADINYLLSEQKDILSDLNENLSDAEQAFKDQKEVVNDLEEAFNTLQGAIDDLEAEIESLVSTAKSSFDALKKATGSELPLGGFGEVDLSGEMQAMMDDFYANTEPFEFDLTALDELGRKFAWLIGLASGLAATVAGLKFLSFLKGDSKIAKAAQGIGASMSKIAGKVAGAMGSVAKTVAGALGRLVISLFSASTLIGIGVAAIIGGLWGLATNFKGMRDDWKRGWAIIKDDFGGRWVDLTADMKVKFEDMKELFSVAWGIFKEFLNEKWTDFKTIFTDKWEAFKEAYSLGLDAIKTIFSEKWQAFKDFFSEKFDDIKAVFSEKWGTFKTFIGDKFSSIKDVFTDKWTAFKTVWQEKWSAISDPVKKVVNKVIGFINTMTGAWNKIKFTLPKMELGPLGTIGGWTVGVPRIEPIPGLFEGGNILRAGSVLVGEKGPEFLDLPRGARVSPLDKVPQGKGDVTLNIEAGAFQFNGPVDSASMPEVEKLLNEFQQELYDMLRSR